MKICLIGSSRFKDLYAETNKRLTLDGHIVYTIATVSSAAGGELPEDQKMVLDLVHLRKIEESDACVLITDETGYFGFSTKREIIWAQMIGKPVMDCRFAILAAFQPVEPKSMKQMRDFGDGTQDLRVHTPGGEA